MPLLWPSTTGPSIIYSQIVLAKMGFGLRLGFQFIDTSLSCCGVPTPEGLTNRARNNE